MALVQSLVSSDKYGVKCPYSMNPKGICVHNTANDASAKNEISYMKSNNNEVSYHIAIDDVESIQAIPFNRNAWAAGDGGSGDGNRNYIHIEICYSRSGGSRFTAAEKRAAKEIAALLKSYGWGIGHVKKHQDFSGKYCPHRTLDMGWQRFVNMISAELSGGSAPAPSPSTGSTMYRVVCGSYNRKDSATYQQNKLKTAGFDSFLDAFKKDGNTFYRVVCGSYKDKPNAEKAMANIKAKGFDCFIAIYGDTPSTSTPAPKPPVNNDDVIIKEYAEKGYGIPRTTVNVRNQPSTNNTPVATYGKGERINAYDKVVMTNAYTWISYVSTSGTRRYIAVSNKKTGERYVDCY